MDLYRLLNEKYGKRVVCEWKPQEALDKASEYFETLGEQSGFLQ